MVHGVTCLLLLAMTIARRGDCLPFESAVQDTGIISRELLEQLHHRLQDEPDIDKIRQEIGSMQLQAILDYYRQRPRHEDHSHLTFEQFERIRNLMDQYEDPAADEDRLQQSEEDNLLTSDEKTKRGGYMSLCHFKICNMGRKRAVQGSAMPLHMSP